MHFNIEAWLRTVLVYGDVRSTQQTAWHLVWWLIERHNEHCLVTE